MGPIIILDKSTLQALSQNEIYFLAKHYYLVVTPILIVEILADLKKKGKDKKQLSKEEVQKISNKLLSMDSAINMYYKDLCMSSLLGEDLPLDGRPIVEGGVPIVLPTGEKGTFLDEPVERIALRNWQNGIFSETEELLAHRWREITRMVNLDEYKKEIKELFKDKALPEKLEDLGRYVDDRISRPDPDIQYRCLVTFMYMMGVPEELRPFIFDRWKKQQPVMFKNFAPYSYHCYRVIMIFFVGLVSNLITTKRTNLIDMEYLYYLPFCMVFSSGDEFHKDISQLLLRDDQEFIALIDLKADLKWLSDEWDSLDEEQRKERAYDYGSYPPVNAESITYNLWQKYMKPWKPGSGNQLIRMSQEEQDKLMESLRPFLDAIDKHKPK